jgi:hypothetical protein
MVVYRLQLAPWDPQDYFVQTQRFSFLEGLLYSELLHFKIYENPVVFLIFWIFCSSLLNQVEHLYKILFVVGIFKTSTLWNL